MSDSKKDVGKQDRIRIDVNDKSEVEYVHQQYPHLTHEQVLEVIRSKGPLREDVIKYLDGLGK